MSSTHKIDIFFFTMNPRSRILNLESQTQTMNLKLIPCKLKPLNPKFKLLNPKLITYNLRSLNLEPKF